MNRRISEIHEVASKNKTLLKQIVPGNKYANIWSDVSRTKANNFTENCFI